jgi:hypothetical protein
MAEALLRMAERVARPEEGRPFDLELRLKTAVDRLIWVRVIGEAETSSATRSEHIADGFVMIDREWRFTFMNRELERQTARIRDWPSSGTTTQSRQALRPSSTIVLWSGSTHSRLFSEFPEVRAPAIGQRHPDNHLTEPATRQHGFPDQAPRERWTQEPPI